MPSVRFSRAPQRHIAPRASGIFWRTRLRSTNANGVCSRWVQCEDFLYTNVMLPGVAEIIHVFEPFVRLEAKVRESALIGIIGEADAALVSDTILLSVNDKLVQMAICPTHDHLHGFVKRPDGRVTRNQDTSPNCWLNVSQDYLELIQSQRHLAHRLQRKMLVESLNFSWSYGPKSVGSEHPTGLAM